MQESMVASLEAETTERSMEGVASHVPVETVSVRDRVYRPQLDALRFFAFSAVYLYHVLNASPSATLMRYSLVASLLPWIRLALGFGLCLFFFLSAYLITSLLLLERARTGRVHLWGFYLRRMLRIWPLYLCFLAAAFILGVWWAPAHSSTARLLAFLLISGNWYCVAFGPGSYFTAHLWSISVEEQFYLLWPSLLGTLAARRLTVLCSSLCVFSLAAVFLLAWHGSSAEAIWFNSLPQALFFASGGLLACHRDILDKRVSGAKAALGVAGGAALWLLAARFAQITNHAPRVHALPTTWGYATVAVGCGLILWGALQLPPGMLPRPLVYLGRISYGLYVFHMPVLLLMGALRIPLPGALHFPGMAIAIGFALTTALAMLSYECLEKPFLRLKSRFEVVHTRPA